MKDKILGFEQEEAVRLGIDLTDIVIIDTIRQKFKSDTTEKREIDGKMYVWVNYSNIIDWLPVLGLKKRALAARLNRLCEKGVLKKAYLKEEGSFTFFRLVEKGEGLSSKLQGGCNQNDKGVVTEITTKKNTVIIDTVIREKEKDNTKVLSKKKDRNIDDFSASFTAFSKKAAEDRELEYNLRNYNITNLGALLDSFKAHVTNLCRRSDFVSNGYMKNRRWLLNAMPYLDVATATGLTLGKGEYLKNNRRYYINPAGRECEVPLDAPPRQFRDQIWYIEERRWGPNI